MQNKTHFHVIVLYLKYLVLSDEKSNLDALGILARSTIFLLQNIYRKVDELPKIGMCYTITDDACSIEIRTILFKSDIKVALTVPFYIINILYQ